MKKLVSALGLVAALSLANTALANPKVNTEIQDVETTKNEMLAFFLFFFGF